MRTLILFFAFGRLPVKTTNGPRNPYRMGNDARQKKALEDYRTQQLSAFHELKTQLDRRKAK